MIKPPKGCKKPTPHQLIRTLRHYHNKSLRSIIHIYLSWYMGKVDEGEVIKTLKQALDYEYTNQTIRKKCDTWDLPIIQAFATNQTLQYQLHMALKSLKWDIVLLEWCSEWKNKINECNYHKGPYFYLFERNQMNQTRKFKGKFKTFHLSSMRDFSKNLTNKDKQKLIKLNWTDSFSTIPFSKSNEDNGTTALTDETIKSIKAYKQFITKAWLKEQQDYIKTVPLTKYRFGKKYNPFLITVSGYHNPNNNSPNQEPEPEDQYSEPEDWENHDPHNEPNFDQNDHDAYEPYDPYDYYYDNQHDNHDQNDYYDDDDNDYNSEQDEQDAFRAQQEEAWEKQYDSSYETSSDWDEGPDEDEDEYYLNGGNRE